MREKVTDEKERQNDLEKEKGRLMTKWRREKRVSEWVSERQKDWWDNERHPIVNFTNIFKQFLRQYTFGKKLQSLTVIREKLHTKFQSNESDSESQFEVSCISKLQAFRPVEIKVIS